MMRDRSDNRRRTNIWRTDNIHSLTQNDYQISGPVSKKFCIRRTLVTTCLNYCWSWCNLFSWSWGSGWVMVTEVASSLPIQLLNNFMTINYLDIFFFCFLYFSLIKSDFLHLWTLESSILTWKTGCRYFKNDKNSCW